MRRSQRAPILEHIRYINPDNLQVRDDFVQFIECDTGITGRALAEKMTSFIEAHGLDLHKLRGQGYDGAGNMSGKTNGAAAIISSDYPLAMYLHCASHTLNLAVVKSLDVQCVRNMIGIANKVSIFSSLIPSGEESLKKLSKQPNQHLQSLN